MSTAYEKDVIAWADEQVALLRSGRLSALDIEHIAEEIQRIVHGLLSRFCLWGSIPTILERTATVDAL